MIWLEMYGNGWITGMTKINPSLPCAAARGATLMLVCAALPGTPTVRSAGTTVSVFGLFAPVLFPENLTLWFLELWISGAEEYFLAVCG
jgi:hypothetical protein